MIRSCVAHLISQVGCLTHFVTNSEHQRTLRMCLLLIHIAPVLATLAGHNHHLSQERLLRITNSPSRFTTSINTQLEYPHVGVASSVA